MNCISLFLQQGEEIGEGVDRKVDLLFAYGVGEAYGVGLEGDAAVAVGAARAILEVALYGVAYGRELGADLVLAACEQIHLQERIAVAGGDGAVFEAAQFGVLVAGARGEGLVDAAVGDKKVLQKGLRAFGTSLHECPVGLVDLPVSEHPVEAFECLGCAGEDHQSRHRSVYAVYDPAEHVARFIILLFKIVLHHLGERAVARLVALHYFPGPFVDHNDMIVFVNYLHVFMTYRSRTNV